MVEVKQWQSCHIEHNMLAMRIHTIPHMHMRASTARVQARGNSHMCSFAWHHMYICHDMYISSTIIMVHVMMVRIITISWPGLNTGAAHQNSAMWSHICTYSYRWINVRLMWCQPSGTHNNSQMMVREYVVWVANKSRALYITHQPSTSPQNITINQKFVLYVW